MTLHSPEIQSAWIALGGNLGDVPASFARAYSLLDQSPDIEFVSSSTVHQTSPVGRDAGETFFNAVAHLRTTLEPLPLLDRLHEIEAAMGRARQTRWGPRTLDLDLLLHGENVIDLPRLQVPHPACWYRRFVLDPWIEIGAKVVHPVKMVTVQELRERLLVTPMSIALVGNQSEHRNRLRAELEDEFPSIDWLASLDGDDVEPTLTIGLGKEGDLPADAYEELRRAFSLSWLELGHPVTTTLEAIREIIHSATGESSLCG